MAMRLLILIIKGLPMNKIKHIALALVLLFPCAPRTLQAVDMPAWWVVVLLLGVGAAGGFGIHSTMSGATGPDENHRETNSHKNNRGTLESAGELCEDIEFQFKQERTLVERINTASFWGYGKALEELIERVQGAYNPSGNVHHPLHDQVDRYNNKILKDLYNKKDELEKLQTSNDLDGTDATKKPGVTKEERDAMIKRIQKVINDIEYIRGFVMASQQYKEEKAGKNHKKGKEQVRRVPAVDQGPVPGVLPKGGGAQGGSGTPKK